MNIVHCIKSLDFSDGGPVRAIIDLSTKLVERGHNVRIITAADPDAPEAWRSNPSSNPHTVPIGPLVRKGTALSAAQREIIAPQLEWADVVHAHGIWEPIVLRMCALARASSTPYVISLRGMLDDWCMDQRRLKKLVYLKLGGTTMLNSAAVIHSTADGELAQSKKWFPKAPAHVIPNLLNLAPFEEMPEEKLAHDTFPMFDSGEPVLLYLSRLHYKKGVEHLIRAAKRLRDEGNPHRVLIAGDGDQGYTESLKKLTTELGMDSHIAFLGLVTGDEKIALYRASDLFVLPTSQENFGFVLYESLAAATPIVTTKGVDTWPELEREAGAVICDQDEAVIARTVSGLTKDRDALKTLGERGREWIFREMHPDRIIDKFETMYTQAASAEG